MFRLHHGDSVLLVPCLRDQAAGDARLVLATLSWWCWLTAFPAEQEGHMCMAPVALARSGKDLHALPRAAF